MADADRRESQMALKILLGIGIVVLAAAAAIWLMVPDVSQIIDVHFSPGVGLKQAALIAFFVTLTVLAALAIFAGVGLLGEIQYMIGAFFSFFILFWLMVAWIF